VLALFDLDGTLTRRDTLGSYVGGFLLRHPWRVLRLPRVLPALARFALGRADHGEVKAALIQAALGGATRAQLDAWTSSFVARLVKQGLLGDARTVLNRHLSRGDHVTLLSASADLYVPAVGRALGFAQVMCTGVEWRGERLVGRLTTANRRGAEKARCLKELRTQHPGLPITAYANAASDIEHLRLADRALLVNGTRRARREAERSGIAWREWR
jgi:HAD superfamily hydrolase (TIGR01490 family)